MKEMTQNIQAFIASLEAKELDAGQQSILLAGTENKGAGAFNQVCDKSFNGNCLNEKSCYKSTNTLACTNGYQCEQAHNRATCSNGKGNEKTQDHETKYL